MAAPMTRHDFLLDGEGMTTASCSGFSPLIAPALPLLGDQRKKVADSICMRSTPLPTVRAYEIVASDSICVDHLLVAQPTGDDVGKGLAELKIEEGTSVKLSGEGLPVPVYRFEKAGLVEKVVQNMFMSGFKAPTPVQRYSIPLALAGRDLLVCAQKGSGKVAALCIPVASMLLSRTPPAGGQYGRPRALLLVPNDRIAEEIVRDTRKLVYETGIRVVHSRKNQNFQIHELEAGVDIFVSTPGRLVDLLISNEITLEAIEYLVICDIGRLLDLGCETKLREIFDHTYIGKPPRQTLLSSDTFEPEVQNFARNFLSDYLLITDGMLEFNIGLTSQNIELVSQGEKRDFLLKVLQKQSFHCAGRVHQSATLVFVETKEEADSLSNWLNNESFCSTVSTVIFGDCSEQVRTFM
jgi:ATP-dependent RNA helicase DDX3X